MFTEEFIKQLIKDCSIANDDAAVDMLLDALNAIRNPIVEKRTRAAGNKTGYVQINAETGKEVARYATIKAAVAALNETRDEEDKIREDSSSISQACRNFKVGKSNKAYGFAWVYGDDFTA